MNCFFPYEPVANYIFTNLQFCTHKIYRLNRQCCASGITPGGTIPRSFHLYYPGLAEGIKTSGSTTSLSPKKVASQLRHHCYLSTRTEYSWNGHLILPLALKYVQSPLVIVYLVLQWNFPLQWTNLGRRTSPLLREATVYKTAPNTRGVVRTGATGAMAPVDFENMCFGTRRFKTKRLKNHPKMPAKTIFSCTKSVIGTR